jgi:hypothetical protein
LEDGVELCSSDRHLGLETAYVYLRMSTGTDYPSRELYFDNFVISRGDGD